MNARSDTRLLFEEIRCHGILSEICWHQNKYDEAMMEGVLACRLSKAIEARRIPAGYETWVAGYHVRVGELLYFRFDKKSEAKNWLEARRRWLDALASSGATDAFASMLIFRWLRVSGENDRATAVLRAAISQHPKDVELAKMYAERMIDMADSEAAPGNRPALLDEARGALSSVVEIAELAAIRDPHNVGILQVFGRVSQLLCYTLVELGRIDEASSVFHRLVKAQKHVEPLQAMEPGLMGDFWRETAQAALMMRPLLNDKRTLSPEDFLRGIVKDMPYALKSDGEFGWYLIIAEGELAARARRLRRPDEARRFVAHMTEYARALVARSPSDLFAHLAMSEALDQEAKNAMRYGGRNPDQALQHALNSAERALAVDPANGKAQAIVTDRRWRLEKWRATAKRTG
jgi:hypothetical protein